MHPGAAWAPPPVGSWGRAVGSSTRRRGTGAAWGSWGGPLQTAWPEKPNPRVHPAVQSPAADARVGGGTGIAGPRGGGAGGATRLGLGSVRSVRTPAPTGLWVRKPPGNSLGSSERRSIPAQSGQQPRGAEEQNVGSVFASVSETSSK
ncbi:hypothetical protein VULLAG_LOCUS22190 [Vulpes lagopus]